jgi:hypothetical protein
MAGRTGHRDRGVRGIPGRWPTAALGRRAGVWAEVRCRRDSRHVRWGETAARVLVVTELGGSVFEFTRDLIGDLFRARNAGVTYL